MKRRLYQLAIIVVSLLLIQGFSRSLIELSAQKNRLTATRDKLTALKQQEQDLRNQLEYYQSDEYIERIARDKLLLTKEGESIIFLPEDLTTATMSGSDPDISQPQSNLPNWQKWLRLFGF